MSFWDREISKPKAVLILAAFAAVSVMFFSASRSEHAAQKVATSGASEPEHSQVQKIGPWCDPALAKTEIITMTNAKIITDLDIGTLSQTGSMSVTVDEPTWTGVSFDRKEVIAGDVACVITSGKSHNLNSLTISVLSNMSRKRLGHYSHGALSVD